MVVLQVKPSRRAGQQHTNERAQHVCGLIVVVGITKTYRPLRDAALAAHVVRATGMELGGLEPPTS